ncbi:hypothetical protein [Melittangium boletus]|uniref:Uncharacterized protein n=1 Tax=Melittangium boletus DSM 14713 TaxID=1294270 RepID=A0A250IPZ6_9BACT|nr:hypothetical protein [Melittangium boletus]ATB33825.1 hypothetical protein MEBOL_007323 [Melittangium boletus DSM 14713]
MNRCSAVRWLIVPMAWVLGGWTTPARPLTGRSVTTAPPRAFSASLQGGPAFCPGARVQVVVHVVQADGSRSAWTLDPEHFRLRTTGALSADGRGGVVLDTDPLRLETGPQAVRIEAVGAPELPAVTLSVPVHYGCDFLADFRGRTGIPGEAGAPGASGEPGENAPSFPGYPARLTSLYRGRPGGTGGPGGVGGAGEPGGDLEIQVTRVPDVEPPRLKVWVRDWRSSRAERFLVDLPGGSLHVDASAGPGGPGGPGGAGGKGGRGAEGWPPVQAGRGGAAGRGGEGGPGGGVGRILVRASPEAAPYLNRLSFSAGSSSPGRAGTAGPEGPVGDAIEPARRFSFPRGPFMCGVRGLGIQRLGPPLREAEPELRVEPLPAPW